MSLVKTFQVAVSALLLAVTQACGNHVAAETSQVASMQVAPELEVMTQSFLRDAAAHGLTPSTNGLVVEYVSEMDSAYSSAYGLCWRSFVNVNGKQVLRTKVHVSRGVPAEQLEIVVYHELAHCLLDERHEETDADIMNPTPLNLKAQNMTWEFAVERMFSRIAAARSGALKP